MDTPIACSLPPDRFAERTAALAALPLRSRAPIAGGERLVFAPAPGVEGQLRTAIAAEQRCCPFLRLALRRSADGLVLDITGPREALPIITELFA